MMCSVPSRESSGRNTRDAQAGVRTDRRAPDFAPNPIAALVISRRFVRHVPVALTMTNCDQSGGPSRGAVFEAPSREQKTTAAEGMPLAAKFVGSLGSPGDAANVLPVVRTRCLPWPHDAKRKRGSRTLRVPNFIGAARLWLYTQDSDSDATRRLWLKRTSSEDRL
jgi:hypothetical protein